MSLMTRDEIFEQDVRRIFGERVVEVSPRLREQLRHLWEAGSFADVPRHRPHPDDRGWRFFGGAP